MRNLDIELKRIEVNKLFLSENKVGYKIYFKLNEIMKNMYVEFPLMESEVVVRMLLSEIKKAKDLVVEDSDDVLQTIVLMRINNQEEIEPRLIDFFSKFHNKVRSFKQKKTSENYIDTYNQLIKERLEL